jgi:ATP synthase protein I
MNDFFAHIKAIQKTFIYAMVICTLCWLLIEGMRPYFAGFILGATISIINAKYLAWKINGLVESSLNQIKSKKLGIGFLTRAATAALAGVITFKYQVNFSIVTVIIGLLFSHFVGYLLSIYKINKTN